MRALNRARSARAVAAFACVAAMTLTACGSDDEESGSSAASNGTGAPSFVEDASKRVEESYAGKSFGPPPSAGPAAQKGKRVALINVGQQAPAGGTVTKTAREANATLGWDLSIYDAEFSPDKFQEGIRQAIARNVDAIWLFAIDCPLAQNALKEAQAAKIPVISQEGADCSDVKPGAPSYFTENLQYAQGSFVDWARALGAAQADWIIAQTDGKAKVIEVAVPDLFITKQLSEGFQEQLAKCETCELVETVENPAANLGPKLQEKLEQTLLKHPDADAMAVSYDDLMTAGGAAAVTASGRKDQMKVIAGTGFEANMDLIRKNQGQNAGYGVAYDYETYAGADLVNRVLAGEKGIKSGVGTQLFDAEHNTPPSGAWKVPVEFREGYERVWSAQG